jgi:hypothetical protein
VSRKFTFLSLPHVKKKANELLWTSSKVDKVLIVEEESSLEGVKSNFHSSDKLVLEKSLTFHAVKAIRSFGA